MPDLGPHWEPQISRLIVDYEEQSNRFVIHGDPNRNDWKKIEYYREIKGVSRAMMPKGGQVMVRLGNSIIAILPDQDDVSLGNVSDDKIIVTQAKIGRDGKTFYNILAMDREDPRLSGYELPAG